MFDNSLSIVTSVVSRAPKDVEIVRQSGPHRPGGVPKEHEKAARKGKKRCRRSWIHSMLVLLSPCLTHYDSPPVSHITHTQYSDMPTEMGNEIVEICTTALDKFLLNRDYEGASTAIKNTLDKKFGPSWQCAIGEGFGFDISCQQKFLLHMYYGKVGVLCYKS